jgi:4-hydroxy-4-methyl-2-oxoglutarate aldolase
MNPPFSSVENAAYSLPPEMRERVLRLRRLDCCAVSDARDRLKIAGVISGVPQQSGSACIAGVLITVKLGIGTPLTGATPTSATRHLGTAAIEAGGPDHVIAIEQHTGIEAGSWGGMLTLGARVKGIAGVLADGPVRDIDEAREYGFPIFTRALTALTARGRIVEHATNVPITMWGAAVHPGDFVIADRSAVIFISSADVDRTLEAAEAIAARESAMTKAILGGTPIGEVMNSNYENMLKR